MRITKEEAADNRARVLKAASRLFREKGYDGVGVADLMQAAGLTHGGFYNHFASKEELAAEASALAFEGALASLAARANVASEAAQARAFADYVRSYLAPETRDAPSVRCPMAALGTDAARQGPAVRRVFADGVKRYLAGFTALVPGARKRRTDSEAARRAESITIFAALVGALTLSRSVAGEDRKLADEILVAVRDELIGSAARR